MPAFTEVKHTAPEHFQRFSELGNPLSWSNQHICRCFTKEKLTISKITDFTVVTRLVVFTRVPGSKVSQRNQSSYKSNIITSIT